MTDYDLSNAERGPEREVRLLDVEFETVKRETAPIVHDLAEKLRMSAPDVWRMALLAFATEYNLTQAKDTFIMVVQGKAEVFDDTIDLLLRSPTQGPELQALRDHLTDIGELKGSGE